MKFYRNTMLIFCALLGFSINSIAQSMPFGDYNTSFITPLSSQLNRYDFYPVSKSTGTTNINIPLFSIPTPDDTQISFNLSYHSSGIKVESRRYIRIWLEHIARIKNYSYAIRKSGRTLQTITIKL